MMSKILPFVFVAAVATSTCTVMVGAFHAGVAMAQPADGSAVASPAPPAAPAAESPAPTKNPDPPTVDVVVKAWRGGGVLAASILTLYLLLSFAAKLDKKHAFYISAGLAGVGLLVDSALRGDTPTAGMLFGAISTIGAIIARGPEKKQTTGGTDS